MALEVTTAPSLALRDQVGRGRLHLALAAQAMARRPDTESLALTTPVWVGGVRLPSPLPDPVPLALHAAHCPYREAMTSALDRAGLAWRVVLSSPSSQAVEACVESGLAVSLIDRSRVTNAMRVLDGLPAIAAHEIVLLRATSAQTDPATDLLAQTLRRHFRL